MRLPLWNMPAQGRLCRLLFKPDCDLLLWSWVRVIYLMWHGQLPLIVEVYGITQRSHRL